jgi:hypothetical protein
VSVSPVELVDFAEQLADTSEACLRASISRAYYGAFHAAKDFHDNLPASGAVTNPNEGVHGRLYQQLLAPALDKNDPLYTRSKRVGYMGRNIHGMRIKADYKLSETVTPEMKAQSIREARKLLQLIGQ